MSTTTKQEINIKLLSSLYECPQIMKPYFTLLLLSAVIASVKGQNITGLSSVAVGQTATYTFNNGSSYNGYTWATGGFGTLSNQTQAGTSYNVDVTWNTPGTASLTFLDNTHVGRGNLSVNISVGTPNTTFSMGCGSPTTISRNS